MKHTQRLIKVACYHFVPAMENVHETLPELLKLAAVAAFIGDANDLSSFYYQHMIRSALKELHDHLTFGNVDEIWM